MIKKNYKCYVTFCCNRRILTEGGTDKNHPGQNLPDKRQKAPGQKPPRTIEREFVQGAPVSTGIFPHSLPEWAFRARPGLWRICLCSKVARIAEHKFANR